MSSFVLSSLLPGADFRVSVWEDDLLEGASPEAGFSQPSINGPLTKAVNGSTENYVSPPCNRLRFTCRLPKNIPIDAIVFEGVTSTANLQDLNITILAGATLTLDQTGFSGPQATRVLSDGSFTEYLEPDSEKHRELLRIPEHEVFDEFGGSITPEEPIAYQIIIEGLEQDIFNMRQMAVIGDNVEGQLPNYQRRFSPNLCFDYGAPLQTTQVFTEINTGSNNYFVLRDKTRGRQATFSHQTEDSQRIMSWFMRERVPQGMCFVQEKEESNDYRDFYIATVQMSSVTHQSFPFYSYSLTYKEAFG